MTEYTCKHKHTQTHTFTDIFIHLKAPCHKVSNDFYNIYELLSICKPIICYNNPFSYLSTFAPFIIVTFKLV